jgi:outer membrane protein assembly factor BamB
MIRLRVILLLAACAFGVTACFPDPPGCEPGDDPPGPVFAIAQSGDSCEPPPDCEDCGEGNGDPHIRTFDGRRYNFHTAAEVVVARAPDGGFEVQWRQQPLGGSSTAGITAVAIQMSGSRVTVVGEGPEIRIDGRLVEFEDGTSRRLPTGVTVHREGTKLMISSPDGDGAVHVIIHHAAMGVLVDPPDRHRGAMEGLLGNADGDPNNDVVLADGTAVANPGWEDVHPELGEAWRVTEETTIFDYVDGEGPDTYWDPTFPQRPQTLADFTAEQRAEAEAACRAAGVTEPDLFADCVYDVLVMGDLSYAALAAEQQLARGRELRPSDGPGGGDGRFVLWDSPLDGYSLPSRQEELVADSSGHVLIQAIRDSDRRNDLIALDLADGSVAWTVPDIDASCNIVADPNGLIFAQLVPRSATAGESNNNADLVAIDPATGSLVAGMRYTPSETEGAPRLEPCFEALRLGPDGHLVLIERGHSLWAFSTNGALELQWRRDYPATQHMTRFAISSDGSAVYLGYVASNDPLALGVERIDLATGEVTGSSPDFGVAFTTRPQADEGGVVLGVRVSGNPGSPEALVRLRDDGRGLVEDWRIDFGSASPLIVGDETFDENFGFRTFTVREDAVVGYARGRILALDPTDGSPLWAHDAAGTNNADRLAADGEGNLYISSFGFYWLRSVGPDGTVNWEVEQGGPIPNAQLREAWRVGPVTPEDVLLAAATDEGGRLYVVALNLQGQP